MSSARLACASACRLSPSSVLALLLERAGDPVTREELRERLWPTGTFVDFEHGLNAVVNRRRTHWVIQPTDRASSKRCLDAAIASWGRWRDLPLHHPRPSNRHCARALPRQRPRRSSRHGATPGSQRPSGLCSRWRVDCGCSGERLRSMGLRPKLCGSLHSPAQKIGRRSLPDGQQVAFGWDGEKQDNVDIYVTLVGSTNVRRLTTHPAEDYAPSWSPDGLRVAFLREVGNVGHVHVMSALGGPDLQVSDFPVAAAVPFSPAASQIAWSPDGRYIAAGRDPRDTTESSAGIYLIPVGGGAPRYSTRPKRPAFDFSPAFSPNGRRGGVRVVRQVRCVLAPVLSNDLSHTCGRR